MRMPTRELLDVDQDHPVLFDASYVVVLNSYALRQCGIDRNTPDPPGGEIVKDAKGEPNGILKNAQSLIKGLDCAAHFTETEKLDALEQQLKRYVAAGLTTIGDRGVRAEQISLYQKLKATGRLPVRAVLTWLPDDSQPAATLTAADRIRALHHQHRRLLVEIRSVQADARWRHDHRHGLSAISVRAVRKAALRQNRSG